ncbi:MAG TPA: phage portal protein [Pusillimonas sp.]|nr:phage portal protein [Pusillimonas sp.]
MGFLDLFRRAKSEVGARPQASIGHSFSGLDDPDLLEYIRGSAKHSEALRNMAALRCVSLICESVGMLPTNLIKSGSKKEHAKDHGAYRILKYKPNGWQTPYEAKSQIQLSVLENGSGYARIIWSRDRPIAMVPLPFERVRAELGDDWQMRYFYTRSDGGQVQLSQREIFHLRDLSTDGVTAIARMKLAKGAIKLARDAEKAAGRIFETGNMAGGSIESPDELSDTAYERMKKSMGEDYEGAENAGKWMILEGGAKANKFSSSAADAQHIENRNAQIAEVARAFGVPRPLLMMDDTSWGSGIEQLGIYFVQYGLQHWFTAWEQALARSFLLDSELGQLYFKFNERALLRGTLKDQTDAFAKSSGSGGHRPWMVANEIRDYLDMPALDDPEADKLSNPMTQKGTNNEPNKPAGN